MTFILYIGWFFNCQCCGFISSSAKRFLFLSWVKSLSDRLDLLLWFGFFGRCFVYRDAVDKAEDAAAKGVKVKGQQWG